MKPGDVRKGRPVLPDHARCERVNLRLDGEAREALAYLAEHWEQGQSATVRRVLIERARRVKGRVGE